MQSYVNVETRVHVFVYELICKQRNSQKNSLYLQITIAVPITVATTLCLSERIPYSSDSLSMSSWFCTLKNCTFRLVTQRQSRFIIYGQPSVTNCKYFQLNCQPIRSTLIRCFCKTFVCNNLPDYLEIRGLLIL